MSVLWVNTYIPNMGCGKDAIWGGPNLWVALSSFCTLRIWLQLQWRSLSSGSLPQGTILTAHLRHIPWISAKTMQWEQKDSEGWGLSKVTWNSGRDETQRSRRRSYWGLPYLYLDLVLRLDPGCWVLRPEEHLVASLIPLGGVWTNQSTYSGKVWSDPLLSSFSSLSHFTDGAAEVQKSQLPQS